MQCQNFADIKVLDLKRVPVLRSPLCVVNGIVAQYFFIASFSWLLVVNVDLWWTFKSMRTHKSKSWKRMLMYCSFGFGLPLIISGISIFLNFTYTCRNSGVLIPEYGVRNCFISPWAQGPYLYYILGVLIALSYVFAGVTLVTLYFHKKDANNLRTSKTEEDKQTIFLFLKLTVVMGLAWAFEVISWAATKEGSYHVVWIILDLYNALSAILIFIIFVCKKTTLEMLEKSYPTVFKGLPARVARITSFSGESSSVNTTSTTASSAPAGHGGGKNVPPASIQLKDQHPSTETVTLSREGQQNQGYEQ